MPTKIIREPDNIDALSKILANCKLPLTVTWTQGAGRSNSQNALAHRWFSDITNQLGDRQQEDVRAECKLTIGIPILRSENEAFRLSYDKVLKPLSYEEKLEAIKVFDMPVTRIMTVKQMTVFLDEMSKVWTERGIELTDPERLRYEHEFAPRLDEGNAA